MKNSLWILGKKMFFTLFLVSFGLTCSIFAQPVKFGDFIRIRNIRTGGYLAVVGKEIFARREASPVTVFKIVSDIQNITAKTGQDVKFGDQIYLIYDDTHLFVGKFGREALIYAGRRRLLGLGEDKLNISLFRVLPSMEKGKAVSNLVSYGQRMQLQSSGKEFVRMNVDISTSPKGPEVFFAIDDLTMTPLARIWTKEFALEFVGRASGVPAAKPQPILPPSGLKPILMNPTK